jgi:hypothetical protein
VRICLVAKTYVLKGFFFLQVLQQYLGQIKLVKLMMGLHLSSTCDDLQNKQIVITGMCVMDLKYHLSDFGDGRLMVLIMYALSLSHIRS